MDLRLRRWPPHIFLVAMLLVTCGVEAEEVSWGDPHPTASPEVRPTIDLKAIPVAEAPARMATVLLCDSGDEWRAMATDLPGMLPNLEPRPIEHSLPPEVLMAIFADPEDERRRAVLNPRGNVHSITNPDGAAGSVIDQIIGEPATDGWMVWGEARNGALPGKVWGAFDGAWTYGLFASDDEYFNMLLTAASAAAFSNSSSQLPLDAEGAMLGVPGSDESRAD